MQVITQFNKTNTIFQNPVSLIQTSQNKSLDACFEEMERALKSGYYLAGFFSYEAGYCFEKKLACEHAQDFPLVYLGVFKKPQQSILKTDRKTNDIRLANLRLNISQSQYADHIEKIRRYISLGDVYQVTYCIKLLFDFSGSSFALYEKLLSSQPVPYPAFIHADEFDILSLSPEMFMQKTNNHITTKPMKGTWLRGRNIFDDFAQRFRFSIDKKNQAENLMITDLLRNDLGRVGSSIYVPRLFEIAGYNTLFQMTSTVAGSINKEVMLKDLFKAVFPSGSVTGAPKIRAMEIIRELEPDVRRIYTGAIGYISPNKDLFFNVPIRTLLIREGKGEMGIGGGIVWDSTCLGEWNEGLLKARFITDLFGKALECDRSYS